MYEFQETFYRYSYWIGDTLKRLLCIVSVSAFSISIAVTLYGALYWAILPSSAITIPVKWSFTSCDIVGQPCSYINSIVKLPVSQMTRSGYNVELLMEVPDSPANRDVGMFLTCATTLPNEASSCSSALVPYRHAFLSSIESFIFLPFYVLRISSSNLILSISLLENHIDLSSTESVLLELQTSKLQIFSARLKIWPCDLSGIRYLMYHHPLISTLLGVATILTVICLSAALLLAKFLQPNKVVIAPTTRTKSNHDLADRQARARLNLEYRQARLRETEEQNDSPKVIESVLGNQIQAEEMQHHDASDLKDHLKSE